MIAIAGIPLAILAITIGWTSGVPGVLYLACWILVCVPGVPLGLRACGRSGMGLVTGLALGYVVTSLAWWAVVAAHVPSRAAFALAWAAAAVLLLVLARAWCAPAVELPRWTRADTIALCLVLLFVPALMGIPYRNLGASDAEGGRRYRAYFTADFVWHMALTAEMTRFEMPPRNPYMADRELHYYWTYFLVPAALSAVGPGPVRDVPVALKANAIATAAMLLASVYCFAATAVRRRTAAVLGVALVVLASSAEGFAVVRDLWLRGRSIVAVRNLNIDAVTSWWHDGLRIDGVHRTMYYTPQHGLSCALGLLAVTLVAAAGAAASLPSVVLAGLLLGGATLLNPFLGMAFCAIYGLSVIADALVRRRSVRTILPHAIAAVPPVCAAAWGVFNVMSDGAGQALTVGWAGHARHAPALTLMLSLGPVLVPAAAGLLPFRGLGGQAARTAGAGLLVGLFLFYFVMLSDQFWVGFRAGQILLAMTTVPLARVFDRLLDARHTALAGVLASVILVLGLPTTAIDAYNASDITNADRGAGFRWTVILTPGQQEALRWVRRATPALAIVQAEPIVRERDQWSLIPSFAERRMSAGLPISLLPTPEYMARAARVREIFRSRSIDDAHALARELKIDYLWVDGTDRAAYPEGVSLLAADPTRFTPVFQNDEVTVYGVR